MFFVGWVVVHGKRNSVPAKSFKEEARGGGGNQLSNLL